MADNNHTIENISESSIIGIIATWFLTSFMPFAVHTFSAILTGLITTTVIYFFNKWLRKKFK